MKDGCNFFRLQSGETINLSFVTSFNAYPTYYPKADGTTTYKLHCVREYEITKADYERLCALTEFGEPTRVLPEEKVRAAAKVREEETGANSLILFRREAEAGYFFVNKDARLAYRILGKGLQTICGVEYCVISNKELEDGLKTLIDNGFRCDIMDALWKE